jgi:galactose mutarotase-like enzyme
VIAPGRTRAGGIMTREHRGWEVIRLTSSHLRVDVVPEKGGDILSIRTLEGDIDLLWRSPWGLRPKGETTPSADSSVNFLRHYPGGWQTIFPNGGDATEVDGVEIPFHGEACVAAWEWTPVSEGPGGIEVELKTTLHLTPFEITRRLHLEGPVLHVAETVRNLSPAAREVMWSHHPAFGAPLISGASRVEAAAKWFRADDLRDVPAGDLEPGDESRWPVARTRAGDEADLSTLPSEDERSDRFGYLGGFVEGRASITNPDLGLRALLTWDVGTFPFAWYWLEAHATDGYPWYGRAYVFAIEPASSYPGQGIAQVRSKTGTLLQIPAGGERSAWVALEVGEAAG